jgi:3-isopropylmalate/(R)-2-methylmalate dehydratase small subunit
MEPLITLSSKVVVLPVNNIDTDQIIPARFLKVTDKSGLGANLFADWRYKPDGKDNPDFVLNHEASRGAKILFAGDNFGCGSSREHAPWALAGWGFRAVISTSFADIFRSNALKNGLLPVILKPGEHRHLLSLLKTLPESILIIDLPSQRISTTDFEAYFQLDGFSKKCLLEGLDDLGYLLSMEAEISRFEADHHLQVEVKP